MESMAAPALDLTPKLLHDIIAGIDVILIPSEYKAALLMVAVYVIGADPKALAEFTGLPLHYVNESLCRMTESRMLVSGRLVDVEWFRNGQTAKVAFYCDVLMVMGPMQ